MQLENKFTIDAPIEKAWEALNTPQTVAPCFPGATLQTYEGDSFTGTVKVKLGPISLTYKGKGTYVSRDDDAHKVVIEASGRDSRGNGTANATVTGTMQSDGPDKTAVIMVTDMTITGRPAQFGRGVISDVADKIIGQFASCVASKLAPEVEGSGDSPPPAAPSGSAASGSASSGRGARRIGTVGIVGAGRIGGRRQRERRVLRFRWRQARRRRPRPVRACRRRLPARAAPPPRRWRTRPDRCAARSTRSTCSTRPGPRCSSGSCP